MDRHAPGTDRRRFLKAVVSTAATSGLAGRLLRAAPQARRPNFLFLLVDDLGWSDLGCYGNRFHETPRLDALAASGVTFTHAYAASAVCSPTRAAILTGKYPARLGITDWIPGEQHPEKPLALRRTATELALAETTLAEALREGGYRTAFVGKWHLGAAGFSPEDQGFDVNIGGYEAGHPWNGYFAPYKNPKLAEGPVGEYLTDRLASESIGLLEQFARDRSRPFFLYHAFYTVHMPIQGKPDLVRRYAEKKTVRPDPHWTNPGYAAMVASLDENVGRMLDTLSRLGLDRDTVVIFTSDNGGVDYAGVGSNYPLRAGKGRYYEGGIREPLIVRWPGVTRAGRKLDSAVVSMDFYPTLLDIAGLSPRPSQHRDGVSLAPLLRAGRPPARETLFWHYPHYHGSGATPCSAIRSGDLKLIRFYETATAELYDLRADPGESRDLAAARPGTVRELQGRLDRWLEEVGAYVPRPKVESAAELPRADSWR